MRYFTSVLSNRWALVAPTALAPATWGTTYIVTTQLLPPGRPLLDATVRALPGGLLLLVIGRRLPRGVWWWRSLVLGTLNIGGFFALLFLAASRLPGGVAATIGAIQPLLVAGLAAVWVGERLTRRRLAAGAASVAGVALLVQKAPGALDPLGVGAALAAAVVMATGVVLAKRWGQPASPLVTTGWQLVAGGLVLVPVTLAVEGVPAAGSLTVVNIAGFAYLTLFGTALAYTLWFRGVRRLPVGSVAFFGLLSPLVAVLFGRLFLDQSLAAGQIAGAGVVLGAVLAVNLEPRRSRVAGTASTRQGTEVSVAGG